MKKIVNLSIIMLLIIVCFSANVYAKPSCNVSIAAKQTEVSKGDEFTIDVNLSNIQSEVGIIAIEATLEYEKDCLTLLKMEGQNSWDTPIKDLSYNEANGKLVIDKKGVAKNDETVLKITFKVNETNKQNTAISLKNIVVADGTEPAQISNVSKEIRIKGEDQKPDTDTNTTPDESQKPDTNIITGGGQNSSIDKNETKTNTNVKDNIAAGKLPKAGNAGSLVIISLIVVLVVAMIGTIIYREKLDK